ncbi:hypothetical protein ACTZWW_12220, partial [Salinarimonas sp. NSM]|uniref:hypothetical protein n=1 Tax=Salinarimonas sp. NSM TaxID=3458003 RepID=UPI0040354F19
VEAIRTGREPKVTGEEALDAGTLARRVAVARARRDGKRAGGAVGLERRMLPPALADCVFPTEMDAAEAPRGAVVFPFSGEDRTVGLVHADGNRLGETLIAVQSALAAVADADAGAGFLLALSNAIGTATALAAQDAIGAMWETPAPEARVLPARPLVLGGDDLTILVRGDCAVDFAAAYLRAFETRTRDALAPVRETARALGGAALEAAVPPALSAGAGIVLVNANHPLDQAGDLSESLTKFAKGAAKKAAAGAQAGRPGAPPATLAFHRVTTALADAYGEALEGELTLGRGADARRLTCNPYVVSGEARDMASFDALAELADVIATEGFPRGPLRRYLGALAATPFQARLDYRRWREIMEARAGRWLDDFDRALAAFGVPKGAEEPFAPGRDGGPPATPLLDAFALVQIGRRSRRGASGEKAA